MTKENIGTALIIFVGMLTVLICLLVDRVPQDVGYHGFSDVVGYLGIPNFLNVISNVPFLIVGSLGFLSLMRPYCHRLNLVDENILAYKVLFLGTALVGIGSGYYHLDPNNETLVWDRLPMTLAFMALYSVIISEYLSSKLGRKLLVPLLLVGLISVIYWWYTEQNGVGDLRLYAVVQFFPMLTIPIILFFFKSKYVAVSSYWLLFGTYVAAKGFEHFDSQTHELLGVVSGHSIKHIFPAVGLYILFKSYKNERTS